MTARMIADYLAERGYQLTVVDGGAGLHVVPKLESDGLRVRVMASKAELLTFVAQQPGGTWPPPADPTAANDPAIDEAQLLAHARKACDPPPLPLPAPRLTLEEQYEWIAAWNQAVFARQYRWVTDGHGERLVPAVAAPELPARACAPRRSKRGRSPAEAPLEPDEP